MRSDRHIRLGSKRGREAIALYVEARCISADCEALLKHHLGRSAYKESNVLKGQLRQAELSSFKRARGLIVTQNR